MQHLLRLQIMQNSLPILKSDGNKLLFYEWFAAIPADCYKVNRLLIFDRCHTHVCEHLIRLVRYLRCGNLYKYILAWYSKYALIHGLFLRVNAMIIRFGKLILISTCFLVYRMPKVHRLYQQGKEM